MHFSFFFCFLQLAHYLEAREVDTVGDVILKHWFRCDETDAEPCTEDSAYCYGFDCTNQLDAALAACAQKADPTAITPVAFTALIGVGGSGSFCDNYRDVLVYDKQSLIPSELFALQGWAFPFTSAERVFDFTNVEDATLFLEFDRAFPQCNGKPPSTDYKAYVGLLPPPPLDEFGNKLGPSFSTSCFDQRPPFRVNCIYDPTALSLRCPIKSALQQIKILRPGERYQLVVELNDPCPEVDETRVVWRLPKPLTFIASFATRLHVILQTLNKATSTSEKSQICGFNATSLDAEFIAGWYPVDLQMAQLYGSYLRNIGAETCALLGGSSLTSSEFDSIFNCGGIESETCGLENVKDGEWRDGIATHTRQRQPLIRDVLGPTTEQHMAPQRNP